MDCSNCGHYVVASWWKKGLPPEIPFTCQNCIGSLWKPKEEIKLKNRYELLKMECQEEDQETRNKCLKWI